MIISREKKQKNIAEYILYMWQIEDLIRAYSFDLVAIEREIISRFDLDEQTKKEMVDWYDNLIQNMLNEKVEKRGHIRAIENIVNDLYKLHLKLLDSEHNPEYKKEFEQLLPYLSDLLKKVKSKEKNIIKILLETLYGILLLKIKKEKISKKTLEATKKISEFISLLVKKYHQNEKDEDFII